MKAYSILILLFTLFTIGCVNEETSNISTTNVGSGQAGGGSEGAGPGGGGSIAGAPQSMSHTFNTLRYLDLVFDGTVINWNNVSSVTIGSDSKRSILQIDSTQATNLNSVKFLISSTDQNLNLSITDTSGATTQQTVVITAETVNL